MNNLTPRKIVVYAISAICLLFLLVQSGKIVENNQFGYYQVKQSFPKGDITVRTSPGFYGQNFGDLYTYKFSDSIALSTSSLDGGNHEATQAIRVQFPDGYADVSFVGQYELSHALEDQLTLQEKYSSNEAVKRMIRQQVIEAFKNTGSLFNSGDAYADKRSDFIRLAEEQVRYGLYVPLVSTVEIQNADGSTRDEKRFTFRTNEDGTPVINKEPTLTQYGITFTQFNVKDMDFDDKLEQLIDARKDAQLSQQDALTATAQGEALVAAERATQEIEKIKQVTIAEKEKEVAVLNAEQSFETEALAALTALETAKKVRAEGEAEAAIQRALVNAGLSPREQAEFDRDTAIGVAEAMAKINLPDVMIFGGGDGGGPLNPFDAVGLQTFMQISQGMNKSTSSNNK